MAKQPFYVILTLSLLTSTVSQDGMAFFGEGDENHSPGHPSSYNNTDEDEDDDNNPGNNDEASSSSSPRGQGHLPSLTLPTLQRLPIIEDTFTGIGIITEEFQNMGAQLISTLLSFLPAFPERGTNDENQEHSYSEQEDIEPSSSAGSSSSFLPSLPSMRAYNVDSQEDIEPSSSASSSPSFLPGIVAYADESLQQSLLTHFALHYFYQQYYNPQNQGSNSACSPDHFQHILNHSSLGDGLTFEAFFDHLPLRAWRNLPTFTEYFGKRYAITDQDFLEHLYNQRPTFLEKEIKEMTGDKGININDKDLPKIKTFPSCSFFYQLPLALSIRDIYFSGMDTEESLFYLSQLYELFITTQADALRVRGETLNRDVLMAQIWRAFPLSAGEVMYRSIAEVDPNAFLRPERVLPSLFSLFFHYGQGPLMVHFRAQTLPRVPHPYGTSVTYHLGVNFLEPRLDLPATDQPRLSTAEVLRLLPLPTEETSPHPYYTLTPEFRAHLEALAEEEAKRKEEGELEEAELEEGKGKERAPED